MNKKTTMLRAVGFLPVKASTLKELLGPDCVLKNVDPSWTFSDIVPTACGKVSSGSLFIPLNESDEQCAAKYRTGALAVVRDHDLPNVPTIIVPDVHEALAKICCWMFKAIELPSIAVTGSTGKTTTKRMIYYVLKTKKRVYCELENNNTLYDFCQSLQLVKQGKEWIVQEVDESVWYNIFYCFNILKPRIAVVTNIAESHIGYLGSKEKLIQHFEEASSCMPEDGIVIINGDDPDSLRAKFGRRTIRVGIRDQSCECVAQNIRSHSGGTEFNLCYAGNCVHIRLSVLGEHNVYDAMMAYLAGKLSGLKDRDILRGLSGFRNMGIRQNILKLFGVTVYADCYNASLRSISYALKCFSEMKIGKGKRAVILGDIAEIEGFEEETYRQIGALLNEASVDALITCGKDIKRVGDYLTRNLPWYHADNLNELSRILKQHKKEYRAFLFKASRVMRFENCIQEVFRFHYRAMRFQERVAVKREKSNISYLLAAISVVIYNLKRAFRSIMNRLK